MFMCIYTMYHIYEFNNTEYIYIYIYIYSMILKSISELVFSYLVCVFTHSLYTRIIRNNLNF